MDLKDIRRKKTELEAEHAKGMQERERLQKRLNDVTTNLVKIEGAHAILEDLESEMADSKESLQAGQEKPDAPDTIVAEVVNPSVPPLVYSPK